MRAEFFRPEDPETVVGFADWDGRRAEAGADDPQVLDALKRVFRPWPVAVDDPSTRPAGTSGPSVIEPGDLEWFRVAARVRGQAEGFGVRLVTSTPGGWDPAGAYRTMKVWVSGREGAAEATEPLGTPSQ
jgi:hypothetical protein